MIPSYVPPELRRVWEFVVSTGRISMGELAKRERALRIAAGGREDYMTERDEPEGRRSMWSEEAQEWLRARSDGTVRDPRAGPDPAPDVQQVMSLCIRTIGKMCGRMHPRTKNHWWLSVGGVRVCDCEVVWKLWAAMHEHLSLCTFPKGDVLRGPGTLCTCECHWCQVDCPTVDLCADGELVLDVHRFHDWCLRIPASEVRQYLDTYVPLWGLSRMSAIDATESAPLDEGV